MNPSSSSPHSKAAGLTKIFSPASLSILDMSPSIASTVDQCQTHFAQQGFFSFFFFNTVSRTIAFLEDEARHEGNLKKGVLRQCALDTLLMAATWRFNVFNLIEIKSKFSKKKEASIAATQ